MVYTGAHKISCFDWRLWDIPHYFTSICLIFVSMIRFAYFQYIISETPRGFNRKGIDLQSVYDVDIIGRILVRSVGTEV